MHSEMNALSIVSLFDTTAEQRTTFIQSLINKLDDGDISPLKVHRYIKSMEDICFMLTSTDEKKNKSFNLAKSYRDYLLKEANKYSGKSFEAEGAKFEIKETGTKYDYSGCGDVEYNNLLIEKKALDDKIKAREGYLKNIPLKGIEVLNEDEVVTLYPPIKTSTTSLAISLK